MFRASNCLVFLAVESSGSAVSTEDGFAGWDKEYRIPIRVITSRAYHALFMQNMLVAPTPGEHHHFEAPWPDLILEGQGPGVEWELWEEWARNRLL